MRSESTFLPKRIISFIPTFLYTTNRTEHLENAKTFPELRNYVRLDPRKFSFMSDSTSYTEAVPAASVRWNVARKKLCTNLFPFRFLYYLILSYYFSKLKVSGISLRVISNVPFIGFRKDQDMRTKFLFSIISVGPMQCDKISNQMCKYETRTSGICYDISLEPEIIPLVYLVSGSGKTSRSNRFSRSKGGGISND